MASANAGRGRIALVLGGGDGTSRVRAGVEHATSRTGRVDRVLPRRLDAAYSSGMRRFGEQRRRTRGILAALSLVGFGGPVAARVAAAPPAELVSFLEKSIGLNDKQLAAVDAGQQVTKVVRTALDRDVVVFGIVAVDVPRPWFIEHLRETDAPLRSPARSVFGVFGKPALPSDAGQLTLSNDDVKDLKACRPRSCGFKLPAASMAFLSTRIDWTSPTVASELAEAAREEMAAYVNDYRQHGNDAMVVYDDNSSVKSSDALAGLLADSPSPYPSSPDYQRFLLNPFEPLEGVTSEIFWSQDQMPRTRAIVSIQELSIFTPSDAAGATIVATKQLWADHYLEARVDLLTVVDRAPTVGREGGVYLVTLRQYRFDNLPNNRLFSIRNRVADGLRDQTDADLRRIKEDYEESFHPAKVPASRADTRSAGQSEPAPAIPHPGLAHPTG